MKTLPILLASVATFALAAPASAACLDDLQNVGKERRKNESVRRAYQGNGAYRGQYRTLVSAARTFAANDMEERCNDVVEGIKELAAKHGGDDEKARRDAKADLKDKEKARERAKLLAFLKSAKPISQVAISVEELTGLDVRNHKDKDVGGIEDIILRPGGQSHVIVGRGGFIGMGVTYYIVPMDKTRVHKGNESYDMVAVWDISEKQIDAMPKVEKKDGKWVRVADKTPADSDDDPSKDDMKKKSED